MVESYEAWGRNHWEEAVESLGYGGNPDRLWAALIAAREQAWVGLAAQAIADDPEKARAFCAAVRSLIGSQVPAPVVLGALLAMPRACAYCEHESWEWCDDCGGCPECCDSEMHCLFCKLPQYICSCPDCKCGRGAGLN
jgi:hypothetical protein